jgi:hypothetical protein
MAGEGMREKEERRYERDERRKGLRDEDTK